MRHILGATAIFLLAAAPAASATWYAKGTFEPSTADDASSHLMQTTIDITPTNADGSTAGKDRLVYFNAFQGAYLGYAAGVATLASPNVGLLGTGVHTYPTQFFAMLGVWKDCNKDGYVGFGERGLWEYRAELLLDTSVCQRGSPTLYTSGPAAGKPVKNTPWPHNDGQWIHEWIPIGWDKGFANAQTPDYNPVNINDTAARVWGDWGKPNDPPGGTCYVRPQPRGTFHSSGNLIDYADCFGSGRINQQGSSALGAASWATVKSVKNPWGEESDASYVQPWNCGPGTTRVDAGPVHVANVSQPSTSPSPNAGGSIAGTANATGSGVDECNRGTHADGNSHAGSTAATVPYSTEADIINTPHARNQVDHMLYYDEGQRPAPTLAAASKYMSADPTGEGLNSAYDAFEGFWVGSGVTAASRNPFFTRDVAGNFGAQPVTYTTFYASIGATAAASYKLKMPSTTTGTYGSAACPVIGAGQGTSAKNWLCDPALWWKDANGEDVTPTTTISNAPDVKVGPKVGDVYQLRDLDCYDYGAAATRSVASYGTLTGTKCV